MRISLTDSRALVTGGARGIGRAAALALARAGADVAVHYASSSPQARKTVADLQAAGVRAHALQADLDRPEEARRLAEQALAALGRVTILVNNAGIYDECPIDAPDAVERCRKTLRINLEAPFVLAHVLGPRMPRGGSIVNISSRASRRGEGQAAAYAMSKAGLNLMTVSLARELAPRGIRVNAVAPGWVETEMARPALTDPDRRAAIDRETPLGRVAAPEDVAAAVLFLASPLASYVTGQVIHVNGGSFVNTG